MKERQSHVIPAVLYGFLLFFVLLMQLSLLPLWKISGVHPLWIPVLVVFAAIRRGEKFGMLYGLVGGLLCDVFLPGQGFFSLYLMAVCFLAGWSASRVLSKSLFVSMLWALGSFALMDVLYFVLFFLFTGRAGLNALWLTALPETLVSVGTGVLLYLPVKWIDKLGRGRPDAIKLRY